MKNRDSLYSKLIDSLVEEIQTMRPGDKIPSERQLCLIYNISRTTVRNAIRDLEHRGLVRPVQGKGTYILDPDQKRENLSNYFNFTDTIRKQGKTPHNQILEFHISPAGETRSLAMNVEKDYPLIEFLRLRLADDEPMLLERTCIPYEFFPDVSKRMLEERSLYSIFSQQYGRKIHHVCEQFSVSQLESEQAELLGEHANQPCLHIVRHTYDTEGQLIEYTESVASGTKFNYETTYYPQ